jgi:cadmium resistance protein CadD (predicted permease)
VASAVLGAVVIFAGTNVDDLVILTVLFLAWRRAGRPRPWQIVTGQYAGIAALLAVSALVAAGLLLVPDRWTGLLGIVPIALGVRTLLRHGDGAERSPVTSAAGVAAITIANGADNIAVYVPVLRVLEPPDAAVLLGVFAALVAVWCAAAAWLGSHPRVVRAVDRVGHWLVPAVFIGIGLIILIPTIIR